MKKLSLFLAFIMMFSTLSFASFAADAVTATVSGAEAKAGDEITLSVTVKNSPGIAGAQFYVGYDSSVMSYVTATGKCSDFFFTSSPVEGANPVKLVVANLSLKEITGDISIADVKFKVSDSAASGEYVVSVSAVEAYDADIVSIPVAVENSTVTIKGSDSSAPSGNTHKHNYTSSVVAPEGAAAGYTLYKCSCGHSYKADFFYSEVTVTPEPSKFEKARVYTDSFTDVAKDIWYYEYVKLAYEHSLANGTSTTKFSPDSSFTVAQALTAAANIHTVYNGTAVRAASATEAWYVPYVEYCVENKIITEGQFADYNANITRGNMAVVFANILPEEEYAPAVEGAPADVVEESSVYQSVKKLYQAGIVTGDAGTGNYRPDDELARREACVIFTRIAVVDKRAK